MPTNSNSVIGLAAQVQYSGPLLDDDDGWMRVSGEFIASGDEEYLTIANFHPDSSTDTVRVNGYPNWDISYYFIDDVSVTLCEDSIPLPIDPRLTIPNIFTPNGDGVNDLFAVHAVGMKNYHCQIFDRWGVKVFETASPGTSWDGMSTSGQPCMAGVYYYAISAEGEDSKTYERKGFLQLTR